MRVKVEKALQDLDLAELRIKELDDATLAGITGGCGCNVNSDCGRVINAACGQDL